MKITFFKNEPSLYLRRSFSWENAKKVDFNFNLKKQKVRRCIDVLSIISMLVFVCFFYSQLVEIYWLFLATLLLCLPVHELCHAVFCWIVGRKVECICFFPYSKLPLKKQLSLPAAYVRLVSGVWRKHQAILFATFPLILLSIIPAVLAIFISPLRYWLLFLSIYNFGTSSFDIYDVLCFIHAPANCINVGDVWLIAQDKSKPIVIHQIFVTPELDKIHHKCFSYFNGKSTEIQQVYDTSDTITLKQEFREQFHIEQ